MTATTPKARMNCKARLHVLPVLILFHPVIVGQPGRPDRRRGARVSCFHPVAYGEITGAGLCPLSCFSPVIYRQRLDYALAARKRPRELFQLEPERVGLVGDLAASDGVDRRHHAAVAA